MGDDAVARLLQKLAPHGLQQRFALALSAAGQGVVIAKARRAAVDEYLAIVEHERLRGIAYRHGPPPWSCVGNIIHPRRAKGKMAGKTRFYLLWKTVQKCA